MHLTRRDFVKYCSQGAAALGLSAVDIAGVKEALASPSAPTVLWLSGASCTGCSISFLNRVSPTAPKTVADLLVTDINLAYHPNLMAAAGVTAVAQVESAYTRGGYVLVVEGGVPTAFGGATCFAWTYPDANGQMRDVTFREAVVNLAGRAAAILSVGTCSGFGGIPAAGLNPTGIRSVSQITGKKTINIAGCPPHPDWVVYAIAQLLLGRTIPLDGYGRPTALYARTVHSQCPRRERDEAERFGLDGYCLKELGCQGPETGAPCPVSLYNGGVNWCVGANSPCIGCTDPRFGQVAMYSGGERGGGDD